MASGGASQPRLDSNGTPNDDGAAKASEKEDRKVLEDMFDDDTDDDDFGASTPVETAEAASQDRMYEAKP